MTMTPMSPPSLGKSSPNLASVTNLPGLDAVKLSEKDYKKLIAYVNEQFTKSKQARAKSERQWYLNLAMYFGKQNVLAQDTPGTNRQFRLWTPPAPYYRSRPVINLIRPLMRTEMSKLTAQKPNAFIVPASGDDRDMFAAQCGEQIWDSLFRQKNIHKVLRRMVFWTCMTGNGFIKSWWDEDKTDVVSNQLGDLCYEPITPFHLFVPDLRESELEDQAWVMHASNRNAEQLAMQFGQSMNQSEAKGDLLEESFLSVMSVDTSKGMKPDETLVLEIWIKPKQLRIFPDGGMITVANNKILSSYVGWPYEHAQYPFAHFGHIETGKFYRDSTIVDLISLQREYNRTRGQIIEAKNRMAKPQLSAEMGSVDPAKITSEPGQVILYRPGFQPPQPIPLQPLPNYVLEEQDRIRSDMNEVSGQHEVSRGQVPPGVTAATAISYLQEQDESKLSYTFDSIEEGIEKIAFQTLCYVKQYWDTPRKVKVTGVDGSFDVMAFEGSDLRDNTDIRVEAGSALPTSRAAKQAFIMDLMKMGFIDPKMGLEIMEIGGINKIYEQIQVDVRQAQRENLKMAQVTPQLIQQHQQEQMQKIMQDPQAQEMLQQGLLQIDPQTNSLVIADQTGQLVPLDTPLIVPVNTWDDNRLHIERHNSYRKSQAFENLDDNAKQVFEEHVNQHIQAIMVGAQGAMGFPPGMLDMANNPETIKELEAQQQMQQQGGQQPPPADASQQQPPTQGQ